MVHIVPFVCCIIHVLSLLLVDCCMTYIILEKSLLKYCAHWLLHNVDFADSDLSLYIVHIMPFVCCIIHVSSILVDCCIAIYHIGMPRLWSAPRGKWMVDCCVVHNFCIHFDCCILSYVVYLSNPRSTKTKTNNLLTTPDKAIVLWYIQYDIVNDTVGKFRQNGWLIVVLHMS